MGQAHGDRQVVALCAHQGLCTNPSAPTTRCISRLEPWTCARTCFVRWLTDVPACVGAGRRTNAWDVGGEGGAMPAWCVGLLPPRRVAAVARERSRSVGSTSGAEPRFREARAGPRRAASAARAAARRRRQARRGEALRRGGRGGRCRTAEARATRGAAATPPTAPARAAAAQAVALPISGASERARARASRRVCPVRRVRHGWRGGGAALCVCYAVARHLLPPTRKTSSRWTADVGLARATRGRLESPLVV